MSRLLLVGVLCASCGEPVWDGDFAGPVLDERCLKLEVADLLDVTAEGLAVNLVWLTAAGPAAETAADLALAHDGYMSLRLFRTPLRAHGTLTRDGTFVAVGQLVLFRDLDDDGRYDGEPIVSVSLRHLVTYAAADTVSDLYGPLEAGFQTITYDWCAPGQALPIRIHPPGDTPCAVVSTPLTDVDFFDNTCTYLGGVPAP